MSLRSCAECRELISAFIDGEIGSDDRARLMGHLANCADCRATLDAYRAIGSTIRSMPPVHPPEELSDSIYAQTIDSEPRRLFIITSRLGYSLAAVAAVLLIFVVAAYLLIGGYQRGIQPSIASTEPQDSAIWPIQKPIQITFNKPMDHESVEKALAIQPHGEDERLNLSWDGNTLIIGANQTLKPGANYQVRITTSARDKWGHRLETDFSLSFATTSTVQAFETPTPGPTPTPTQVASSLSETPTEPSISVSPTRVVTHVPATGTPQTEGTPVAPANPTIDGPVAVVTSTPVPETPAPEPTSDQSYEPTPTPTDEAPASTATPTATQQTISTPTPTATATVAPPTATVAPPTATATATPSVIAVTGSFGDLYWGDSTIQNRLGAPIDSAYSVDAMLQGFQNGNMYFRADTSTIYELVIAPQVWNSFLDTSSSLSDPTAGPELETWIPGGVFGSLWSAEPSVSGDLGYATEQYADSFTGQVQDFEGGLMLLSPSSIYVVYSDGSWEFFPNTSAAAAAGLR